MTNILNSIGKNTVIDDLKCDTNIALGYVVQDRKTLEVIKVVSRKEETKNILRKYSGYSREGWTVREGEPIKCYFLIKEDALLVSEEIEGIRNDYRVCSQRETEAFLGHHLREIVFGVKIDL